MSNVIQRVFSRRMEYGALDSLHCTLTKEEKEAFIDFLYTGSALPDAAKTVVEQLPPMVGLGETKFHGQPWRDRLAEELCSCMTSYLAGLVEIE